MRQMNFWRDSLSQPMFLIHRGKTAYNRCSQLASGAEVAVSEEEER